jgi:hypothetical protein
LRRKEYFVCGHLFLDLEFLMFPHTKPSLLVIGIDNLRVRPSLVDVHTASTLREAVAVIRLSYFDLLLVGLDNPKVDVWTLMHRLWATRPRWLLISPHLTSDEEVRARSLGALLVLHELPNDVWLADFAASLRQRILSNNVRAAD